MKKYLRSFLSFVIILSMVFTYVYGGQGAEKNLYGFTQISQEYLEDIDSNVVVYNHTGSGANLIHIDNQDPNRAFAIGFKTPIHDNTGVNHIVEHAVFTGSEKYNIKDVFFEMKKKSPNIFMNASTAADMTIYPFSTRNEKDYFNLMDVYLDAVFFPNLQKQRYGFDQEGWHYSLDQDENLQISGVVYNEMKGASVAPRRILAMANRTAMFPDTMYIYNAGGNPNEIPDLTYEAFKDTHKEYYVPSNSCSFIYGDVKIEKVLKRLDGYYSQFEKHSSQNISQKQVPFSAMKYYMDYYPASNGNDDYYMSTNYAVGEIKDVKLQLSMGILMELLVQYEDSPIRRALREQQGGRMLSYDIDSTIPQPMYSIVTTDVKKGDIKDVENLIQDVLEETAEEGFSKDLIKMALNQYEVNLKEQTSDVSKGINMAYNCLYSWGHGLLPANVLQTSKLLEKIKQEGNSQYFQDLLKSHMLDNKHKSQVVLAPDPNFITKSQMVEEAILARELLELDETKARGIITNKKNLNIWQNKVTEQGSVPDLALEDISHLDPLPKLDLKGNKQNQSMYYVADTKGLIYMNLYFDTSYIPQESLNELFLFSHLMSQKEKDLVALYTGGMATAPIAIPSFESYDQYDPKLRVSLTLKEDNMDQGFYILNKIMEKNLWDEQWLLSQVKKIRRSYEDYFKSSPLELMNMSVGNTQEGASRYEYEKLLPFYDYICQVESNYDEYKTQVIDKLTMINRTIFNKEGLVLGATLEETNIKAFEKKYKKYMKGLSKENYSKINYQFESKQKRQGFEYASDVQYIVWGGNYKEKRGSYNGALYVLTNILNAEYMLENIRVRNGAYGAGIKFNPYGDMNIYTYQDPKLSQSLQIIESIPKYINDLQMDQETLDDYKIGALSKFEQEQGLNDHPATIGETLQYYHLSGLTSERVEQVREDIFKTTLKDIKDQGKMIEKLIQDKRYSVAGSQSKLLTNRQYFDIIQSFQRLR